jgi:hypothetical protein
VGGHFVSEAGHLVSTAGQVVSLVGHSVALSGLVVATCIGTRGSDGGRLIRSSVDLRLRLNDESESAALARPVHNIEATSASSSVVHIHDARFINVPPASEKPSNVNP